MQRIILFLFLCALIMGGGFVFAADEIKKVDAKTFSISNVVAITLTIQQLQTEKEHLLVAIADFEKRVAEIDKQIASAKAAGIEE